MFSKHKNALYWFCDYLGYNLSSNTINTIEGMNEDKRKKRRRLNTVNLNDVKTKINYIRDKKLKLSFLTILACGFRISELSQIRKEECIIYSDVIVFRILNKNDYQQVAIYKADDHKLFNSLIELINNTSSNNKVFYSTSYLQTKAKEKGFTCEDLRRMYAKLMYQKYKSIRKVQELLRQSNIRNTKRYLKSKVQI